MMRVVAAALALAFTWTSFAQADGRPVVVELFTSQGCSSCPPADAILHDLAEDPDVIALALHVDYWDYIGWKDSFADPAFTLRQRQYARVQSERMVYTPQMMFNGVEHVVGNRDRKVKDALAAHKTMPELVQVRSQKTQDGVQIFLDRAQKPGPYVVHLVSYRPKSSVSIRRGENAGRTIEYANVVNGWRSLREWNGRSELTFAVEAVGSDPMVVLVQRKGYGEIVGGAHVK